MMIQGFEPMTRRRSSLARMLAESQCTLGAVQICAHEPAAMGQPSKSLLDLEPEFAALPQHECRFERSWTVVHEGGAHMPKIIVNAFLTLDGVMQAPGGPDEDREGGFEHGGWQGPYSDDVMGRLVTEGFIDADGFLLGRKTYDIFSNYWPKITDPGNAIATALNSRPKHVVSRSLERVGWNNAALVKGDVVAELRRLREQPGRT